MSLLARCYVAAILVYLFAPVAVTVLFSFADSPRLSLPVTGLTLRWYRRIFHEPLFLDALGNSLLLAGITAEVIAQQLAHDPDTTDMIDLTPVRPDRFWS